MKQLLSLSYRGRNAARTAEVTRQDHTAPNGGYVRLEAGLTLSPPSWQASPLKPRNHRFGCCWGIRPQRRQSQGEPHPRVWKMHPPYKTLSRTCPGGKGVPRLPATLPFAQGQLCSGIWAQCSVLTLDSQEGVGEAA